MMLAGESFQLLEKERPSMKTEKHLATLWKPMLLTLALAVFGATAAAADFVVGSGQPVVIADDIFKRLTSVESVPGTESSEGNSNQGHGNNEDGVDSSNPGADVFVDSSTTDDESSGGGAAPSKGKGKGKN